jgi:hypothetical protein
MQRSHLNLMKKYQSAEKGLLSAAVAVAAHQNFELARKVTF